MKKEASREPLWRIPLADVDLGPEEEAAVLRVLHRRWLSMGGETAQFEAEFAAMLGQGQALAVTNCTAALHLAGLALGWGPGDEIIVPSLTFVASVNAVRYTGATPVFADVSSENDFSLSPADVEARITPRTRAMVVVHYAGYACDMPLLVSLAERYGLDIVEDVAHAPGGSLNGQPLGTWGRAGCFSFFANKNMTTGEGGMIVTTDEAIAARLRLLRSHGMTSLTWDRHKGHAWSYDVVAPGYNYRLDEMRAAVGRAQLAKLETNNARRRELDRVYAAALEESVPEVGIPYRDHPGVSAAHLRPILLPEGVDRRRFMEAMRVEGIQTSIHYPPVHRFSYYRLSSNGQANRNLPDLSLTETVGRREVTLPLYPAMTEADVHEVVRVAAVALEAARESKAIAVQA